MFHLNVKSDFSILTSSAQIKYIEKRLVETKMSGCALTDYGSISGAVGFINKLQKAGLKPIVGSQLRLPDGSYFSVLAKNLTDWKQLIKLTSFSNEPERVKNDKPTISLKEVAGFSNSQFICFTGYLGSDLFNSLFKDVQEALKQKDYGATAGLVHSDWRKIFKEKIYSYYEMFAKENLYLAVQTFTEKTCPALQIVNKILRSEAPRHGIKLIALADPHYMTPEGAADHRVLLASRENCFLKDLDNQLGPDSRFLRSNDFFLPTAEEIAKLNTEAEIQTTDEIAARCESYKVAAPPQVPKFECGDKSQSEFLKELCRAGWKTKIQGKIPKETQKVYAERIKKELDIITSTETLPSYFLIVQDYCNWARQQGMKIGERGSGAGCLISYLVGITNLDPIEYDLIFERFYDASRKDSLPDIDVDFPKYRRDEIVDYVEKKYGSDYVSSMITFNKLQGRGALKEVLRAHNRCGPAEMNRITENIPQDADISDHLQVMRDTRGEASSLIWALENFPEDFAEWCEVSQKDGEIHLEGPLANDFLQAMRIEGCKKSPSRHASGYVLSAQPLAELCPLVYDKKTKKRTAGFEMGDLEALGIVKLDLLVSLSLDKIMTAESLIRTGKC